MKQRKFTPAELEEMFGIQFLRDWTDMVSTVGELYDEKTPEQWAQILISRLDEMGYCIASKSKVALMMNGRQP